MIKANGVTVSNRVDLNDSAVIYEAETPIFRNSALVRKALEELAEIDGRPQSEPFVSRLGLGVCGQNIAYGRVHSRSVMYIGLSSLPAN